MPHPFFEVDRFPWERPDADALWRALFTSIKEPGWIAAFYDRCGGATLPPLNLQQSPALIWREALDNLAAASALRELCRLLLADPSRRAIHAKVQAVVDAKEDPAAPAPSTPASTPLSPSVPTPSPQPPPPKPRPTGAALAAAAFITLMVGLSIWKLWDPAIRSQPITVNVGVAKGFAYIGPGVADMLQAIRSDTCTPQWLMERLRGRRCITLQEVDDRVDEIVQCTNATSLITISNRDPSAILRELAANSSCISIANAETRRWSVRLSDQAVKVSTKSGDRYYCGCSPDVLERLRKE